MGCLLNARLERKIREKKNALKWGAATPESQLCQSTRHKTKYRIRISGEKKWNRIECETQQCGKGSRIELRNTE